MNIIRTRKGIYIPLIVLVAIVCLLVPYAVHAIYISDMESKLDWDDDYVYAEGSTTTSEQVSAIDVHTELLKSGVVKADRYLAREWYYSYVEVAFGYSRSTGYWCTASKHTFFNQDPYYDGEEYTATGYVYLS